MRLRDLFGWALVALVTLGALALAAHASVHGDVSPEVAHHIHGALGTMVVAGAVLAGLAAARGAVAARARALAEAEAEQGVALAALVHELRNPLSGISLLAGAVAEDAAGTPAAAHAARLRAEVDALARLLDEGLAEARDLPPERRAVTLAPLLAEVAAQVRPLADGRGVEVRVAADGEARADRDQLRRALVNLARNAVEASPENGVVLLTGRPGAAGGGVVLEVEDRGPGLDAAARQRLFRPFTTTKALGTGLGLALAKKVADAHGGTLELLPREGGGTLARLTLPDG